MYSDVVMYCMPFALHTISITYISTSVCFCFSRDESQVSVWVPARSSRIAASIMKFGLILSLRPAGLGRRPTLRCHGAKTGGSYGPSWSLGLRPTLRCLRLTAKAASTASAISTWAMRRIRWFTSCQVQCRRLWIRLIRLHHARGLLGGPLDRTRHVWRHF